MRFILLLGLGVLFVLSFIMVGRNPSSLYWDELAIGIDAYSIAQTGKDIHGNYWLQTIYSSYGDYKAALPIMIVSLSVRLLGLSEFSVRLPFFIFSWLGLVGCTFLLSLIVVEIKKDFSRTLIWLGVLMVLLTPWYWHFSHVGFESGMSLSLLMWSISLIFWGLRNKGWGIALGTLIGLSTVYTYFSARIIFPLFCFVLMIVYLKEAIRKWPWILVSIVIFIVGLQPLLRSPFYPQSEQLRWSAANIVSDGKAISQSAQLILENNNSFVARVLYHRYWFMTKAFLENYLTHFNLSFLLLSGDSNLRHHSGWGGQLLLVNMFLFLIGLYWMFVSRSKRISWLIFGWLLVAPLTASIPYEVPHASRAIYMLIPIGAIYLFGLIQLYEFLVRNRPSRYYKVTTIVILLMVLNFGLYFEDYLDHYLHRSRSAWQIKNKEMVLYAIEQREFYEKIIISDAYRLPALSVLFYQPSFIDQIRPQEQHKANQEYKWLSGFDKFQFTNVARLTSDSASLIIGN